MEEGGGPEGDSSADSYYILRNRLFDSERHAGSGRIKNYLNLNVPRREGLDVSCAGKSYSNDALLIP